MKLQKAQEAYYDHSRTLSTINRQLALAGIAIVWFFVQPTNSYTHDLNFGIFACAFIFFSLALFFDILQYAIATLSWGWYSRNQEKKGHSKFLPPRQINWIPISMIFLKVIATIFG